MLGLISIIPLTGIAVAGLLWLRRGRKYAGVEPRCAACGYIVHGLPTPTCPECGANLAAPKAIVTGGRLPPSRIARSIAWTLLCLVAVFIPASFIWDFFAIPAMPEIRDINRTVTLYWPASKSYKSIAITAHTHDMALRGRADPLPRDLKIELTRSDGTTRILQIDSATLYFRDASVSGSAMSPTPLDAAALVAWLRGMGAQGETDQLTREMAKVMEQVRQALNQSTSILAITGAEFSGIGGSSGSSSSPLPWVGAVPFAIAGIVWSIGIIRIVRKPSKSGDSHMVPATGV